jgi:LCP family protein required for cell wall assembly
MKTTLKRGVGRAAEVNGNGRAVYPPEIAPPMRRYRQPDAPSRGALAIVGTVVLWVVIAALMLAGGVAGGVYLYVDHDIAEGIQARSLDVREAQRALDAVIPGEPTVALVLGYDKRAGVEGAETGHSDTLMLVRADPELDAVTMLSFPRDLAVEIHGCPARGPFVSRINDAYGLCGSTAAIQTVRELTGVPINFLVTVNFRGFKQVVSHLGGVWVDVDRRYFNDNTHGGENYATIDLQPGYQKLNGQKALDFVRYRHTDSDLYRLARQQVFLKAVKQRAREFDVLDLPKLVNVVTSNVEVGKGDGTSFDARALLDYALFAYQLPAGNVFQTRIAPECYAGNFELSVSDTCLQRAVNDFEQPDVQAPLRATDAALNRRRPNQAPAPAKTTVTVLNGNGQGGVAASTGVQLASRGYVVVAGGDGNAPSWEYLRTEIYYQGTPQSKAAAQKLAELFGEGARVAPLPQDIVPLSNDASVTVILGQDYAGSVAAAPVDRTPERRPPQVSRDSSAVSALNEAKRRVPFAAYAPTVVATGYRLDDTTPVRVYKLGDHNSIRLTYTNGVDFWGIQMTDWDDAPVLGEPNDVTTIGKRTYRLYYNGPHLHMVVLEAGGATYWVTNTLLDKLSNETMLEIAKGLRPLSR